MLDWVEKTERFKTTAHKILQVHEDSRSRIISLGSSYKSLKDLSLKQEDLFIQAFTCLENECYRAAHVMAWAAFMDYIEKRLFDDGGEKLKKLRPKWNPSSPEDIRENITEHQIIDVLDSMGLCVKSEKKALHGLLNKRNECAHPTDYFPGLSDGLGYMAEILSRIKTLEKKKI